MHRLIAVCVLLLGANLFAAGRINSAYGKLPLSFEPNHGQTASNVRFIARGRGLTLFFQQDGLTLTLQSPEGRRAEGLRLHFLGANQQPLIREHGALPGKVSYYLGNDPSKWRTGIPTFAKLEYLDVYPGIDLVYYGNEGQLEFDWVVRPGADPRQIRFTVEGATKKTVDAQGDLLLSLSSGQLRLRQPIAYQEANGRRRSVSASYNVQSEICNLKLSRYDRSLPLVIDPVLIYSTYLGGSLDDNANAIAVDSSQNAYVTGRTTSSDFPALTDTLSGASDAFVTKLNAAGTARLYSTYLGGSLIDTANGIAVDGSGNAYITGSTTSTDFPTASAAQGSFGGATDVFVTKLDSTGALSFSTYLGGTGTEVGRGIAVDGTGRPYITGETDGTFPTSSPFQASSGGGTDAFITRLTAAGALSYSSYLGGTGTDFGRAVAVDSSSNAYVTGRATAGFPLTGPLYTYISSGFMAFVTKINSAGSAVTFSTYLGSTVNDFGFAIAVDSSSNIYVGGSTQSSGFPTTGGAYQTIFGGVEDGFITKINAANTALVYSTFLGGTGTDIVRSMAVTSFGDVWVAGETSSTNFPTLTPLQVANAGAFDVFVSRLSSTGAAITLSTYLGGGGSDFGYGLALDNVGGVYVAGQTSSNPFPTTVGAFQTTYGTGVSDAFVSKLQGSADVSISGVSAPSPVALGGPITYTLTVTNGGPDHATGIGLSFTPPAQVTVTGATSTQGGCTFTSSSAFCSVGAMASAATVTITIPGTVAASSPGVITASTLVTHLENDSNSGNNTANIVTSVGCSKSFIPATGAFDTGANWTGGAIPSGNDNACIDAGKVATLSSAIVVTRSITVDGTLNFAGGAIATSTTTTINGTLGWTAGTYQGGTLAITLGGVANLTGSGEKAVRGGAAFQNAGTVTWSGGELTLRESATVNNLAGGLFNTQADSPIYCPDSCGTQSFTNSGTFRKSTAMGLTAIAVTFNSSGTVDAQTGTINIGAGGTASGIFQAASGALISHGGYTFNAVQFAGSGTNRLIGGTATMSGSISSSNLELNGAAISGTFTLTGSLSWVSGVITGATLTLPSGSSITMSSAFEKSVRGSSTITSSGTITWGGTGDLTMRESATISNQSGGIFDAQNDKTIFCPDACGTQTFNNAGTFQKSAGTATTAVNVTFNNTGTVNALTNVISVNAGGSGGGTWTAGSGATNLYTTSYSFTTGTSFTGAGLNRTTGGTHTFTGTITAANLELGGGIYSGTATINGTFSWTGGQMGGSGVMTVGSSSTLTISGSGERPIRSGYTLGVSGTLLWTGTNFLTMRESAVIAVNSGGLFHIQNASPVSCPDACGTQNINNAGTVRKSVSAGTTSIADTRFNNNGTVDVQTGTLSLNGGGTSGGVYTISSGAILNYGGGTQTVSSASNYSGAGLLTFSGGLTTYTAAATITTGQLGINGGQADFSAGSPTTAVTVNLSSGTLSGTGTLSISGGLTWTGGVMTGSGTTSLGASSVSTINSANEKALRGARILSNSGSVTWLGTGLISMRESAVINNQSGGLWDAQDNASINCPDACGTQVFNNSGIFRKSVQTGTTSISIHAFNNDGTVDVQAGTLQIGFGGASTGTFNAASGATLSFVSAYTFNTGTSFTGTGTIQTSGATTTAAGTVTMQNYTLIPGAAMTVPGTINITGTLQWTGGTITGGGTVSIQPGGSAVLSTSNEKALRGGTTLSNSGTLVWGGTGDLTMRESATITNQSAGLFDVQSDKTIYCPDSCGSQTFNNSGTFRKSTGTGTTALGVAFNNPGTVDTQTGTINIGAGGTANGIFHAASGATNTFTSSYTFTTGTQFTGPGVNRLAGGTASLSGAITSTNLELNGATLTGSFNLTGSLSWVSGVLSGLTVTVPSGSSITTSTATEKFVRGGSAIFNSGTFTWGGTGDLTMRESATFHNQASGVFDAQNDRTIYCPDACGTQTFNNNGLFKKSGGTGTTTVSVTFNNAGTMSALTNTVTVNGGGAGGGTWNAATSTNIIFAAGYSFSNGTTFTGAGVNRTTGGTQSFSGTISATNLDLAGGLYNGTATINGTFGWTGGQMGGSGALTVGAGGILNISGALERPLRSGYTMNIAGTVNWTGTGSWTIRESSVINTLPGGQLVIQTDQSIFCPDACGTQTINNNGTMVKSVATGTTTFGVTFNNAGTVNATSGTMNFSNYTQTAGMTILNGGAIGAPLTLSGGQLTGAGTFTGNVNNTGGIVAPGLSPGIMSISGNYTQSATGTLSIELGGTTPGLYDQLVVSGTATLNGTLALSYFGGFFAAPADTFTILTAASRVGTFSALTGPAATPNYNATSVVLSSVAAPTPPDLTIAKTHSGNFTQGQSGATFTITVSNTGGQSTSGTVTVVDTPPASLTATAISGTGWTCTLGTLTCTRSDVLSSAASYPAITLTVNVATNAPANISNTAVVSGGGETVTTNNTASDPTTVNAVTGYFVGDAAPDLTDLNADLILNSLGEYGDRLIDNLDLIHALRAVTNIPGFLPSQCSDRFDTMDSFPLDGPGRGGNGVLNNFDLIQTLRRITGLDTTRPARNPGSPFCAEAPLDAQRRATADRSLLRFGAAVDGRTPVYLVSPQRMRAFSFSLSLGRGRFVITPDLRPSLLDSGIPGVVAAAWLEQLPVPKEGRLLLGWIEGVDSSQAVIYGMDSTLVDPRAPQGQ